MYTQREISIITLSKQLFNNYLSTLLNSSTDGALTLGFTLDLLFLWGILAQESHARDLSLNLTLQLAYC